MATRSHKILRSKAAGRTGRIEVSLPSGRRIDARSSSGILTEVQRLCGGIPQSVSRLKEGLDSGTGRKARLRVPPNCVEGAYREMRRQRVRGEIVPISQPRAKVYVPKRRG